LFTDVTDKKQIDSQIVRMSVLSGEDSLELLKTTLSNDVESNPIVSDLLNGNEEGLKEKISHEELIDIQITSGYVNFEIGSYRSYSTIGDVSNTISSYEYDINNSFDRIYEDLRDRFYNDNDIAEEIEPLFKKYYETACDYHLIDDSPSIIPNHPSFREHRHDQSIFNMFVKKLNLHNYDLAATNQGIDYRVPILYARNRTGNTIIE
jgi:hypothetical protein